MAQVEIPIKGRDNALKLSFDKDCSLPVPAEPLVNNKQTISSLLAEN